MSIAMPPFLPSKVFQMNLGHGIESLTSLAVGDFNFAKSNVDRSTESNRKE